MLHLRTITLKDYGTKKEPRLALRCEFGASKNKYSKTYPVNVFEDSSLGSVFAMLVGDFNIEEPDKVVAVDCKGPFEGELFTEDCKPHYVEDAEGNIVERDGEKVIATSITSVVVYDWGQTKESVIKSFERTWAKNDLLCEEEK